MNRSGISASGDFLRLEADSSQCERIPFGASFISERIATGHVLRAVPQQPVSQRPLELFSGDR
jgi:hypothetical protein